MKAKVYLGVAVGLFGVAIVVMGSAFWYKLSSLYADCRKVEIGMREDVVKQVFAEYIEDSNYTVGFDGLLWGNGIYITSNISGNGCGFAIENGVVTQIELRFE